MKCQWDALLKILPPDLRCQVDRLGSDQAQELRLRLGRQPLLIMGEQGIPLEGCCCRDTLNYVVNAASRYSPWTAATSAQGYITAPGGHRIGICGSVIRRNGRMDGIREPTSLCIRIARDFPGIGREAAKTEGSLLILGAPGWGKTTLLRDVIRRRSQHETVCVVEERGEIFPEGFDRGPGTDVLTGCPKAEGIMAVLRTMSPQCIAVDEITEAADTQALLRARNCGVSLLATIHASSPDDLRSRTAWRELAETFDAFAVLHRDRSYTVERVVA